MATQTPAKCAMQSNRAGVPCDVTPTFGVYWQTTGADEMLSCPQHLAKALRVLRSLTNTGAETTFKVRFLPPTT